MRRLVVDDDNVPSWLTPLLAVGGNDRARLRNALVTGTAALGVARQFRTWTTTFFEKKRYYTVTLKDTDEIYIDVHEWLLSLLPSSKQRTLNAFSSRNRRLPSTRLSSGIRRYVDEDMDDPIRQLLLTYDDSNPQTIVIDGHRVQISVAQPEVISIGPDDGKKQRQPGELSLRVSSIAGRDVIIGHLQRITTEFDARERTKRRVHIASAWGGWETVGMTEPRPVGSVVLAEGQLEELIADLSKFIELERDYIRLGIPWHRGYLLHGPPGVGKTSVAQVLGTHFDLDVYYMPLADMRSDTDLAALLGRVEERSLLLLEDVDVAHAARERDDKERGISLSGLLNALDGVVTPHGLITVMTTNDRSVLDDAILRPGRADRQVHITYLDANQLERLLIAILGVDVILPYDITVDDQITPAEIVEVIKPHLADESAQLAIDAVQRYLEAHLARQN